LSAPDPIPEAAKVLVTKSSAALSQLETAIGIWFEEGDPVSVHTLAVAAHDCFSALVEHKTKVKSLIKQHLKTQSSEYNRRIKVPRNFFVHGFNEFKGTLVHIPVFTDMLMLDSAWCYQKLQPQHPRALIEMFAFRVFGEKPDLLSEEAKPHFAELFKMEPFNCATRSQFFEKNFAMFAKNFGWGPIHRIAS
jgi:hypothetical protein